MDDAAPAIVPNLRGVVDVPGCGHYAQRERPEAVTKALLEFPRGL
ncbi:alpha/beta fold hydrolase [Streptomyces olivaceoviridis]